ncbi:MAG TPA: mechanosensitive ion channel domain-containing protein [Halanaerobiales bacterium]|nr:mechanosensitive ion channel domain-containing protein [Halanaerobiales bacterium]
MQTFQFENLYNSAKGYVLNFLDKYLLSYYNLAQIIFLLLLFGISNILSKKYKERVINLIPDTFVIKETLGDLFKLIIYVILLWLYIIINSILNFPTYTVIIVANLLTAWIIINLLSDLIKNELLSKIFSILIWTIAALHVLGIYEEIVNILSKISFRSGNIHISLLMVIKGILTLFIFLWIAMKLSSYSEKQIKKLSPLTPSIRVLLTKLLKFVIFTAVILITMSSLGIDLTALAVVGGAVGVGVGFGLQKIVSNFISGIIILLDKSVKPGDVIEIDNVYGQIKSIGLRYISVLTLDGKEYIIPNEDLITKKVINWSYSNNLVRTSVSVGVSYNSDVEKAMELLQEAIAGIDRILSKPPPKIFLNEFSDSSVNIEVKFWIRDPENGINNIKSEVNKSIWKLFKEHDIEIPFPQQDIHFKSLSPQVKEFFQKE